MAISRRQALAGLAALAAAPTVRRHRRSTAARPVTARGEGIMPVTVVNTGTFNPVPSAGFPDSTNTGFQNAPGYTGDLSGSGLADGSAIAIQSNHTYSFFRNLGQYSTFFYGAIGTASAPVSNVTFIGCCWENVTANGPAVSLGATGPVTFSYCTFRPTGLTAPPPPTRPAGYQYGIVGDGTLASPGTWNSFCNALTVDHCDMWGFANATKIVGGSQAAPHIFQYNYIHDPRFDTSGDLDHCDGIGAPSGGADAYVQIIGNSIVGPGNPLQDDTQAIAYQNSPGPSAWDHFTVTGNLFGGFGFTVNITGGTSAAPVAPTNMTFTGNTFTTLTRPIFGPVYSSLIAGTPGSWRNNKWRVPPGAVWGNPAHDGWFWLPADSAISGTDDTPFVSLTDFTG